MPIYFLSYVLGSMIWIVHFLLVRLVTSWVRWRGQAHVIMSSFLYLEVCGSSLATFFLLWLRLVVKVGFCVWRLAFGVWRLPQRGVEHETTNPRAVNRKIRRRKKKSVTIAFQCAPSHGIRLSKNEERWGKGWSLNKEMEWEYGVGSLCWHINISERWTTIRCRWSNPEGWKI